MAASRKGKRQLSPYEREALEQIHLWKGPQLNWFNHAMRRINWPLDKAGDAVMNAPRVGHAIQKAVEGIVSVANDVAQWTVRPEAIFNAYRTHGDAVRTRAGIAQLTLESVDKRIRWLDAKYKGLAFAEGAGAGAAGLFAIAPDIVTLITLNLRAVGEYATYCGFDSTLQEERLFALHVLGLASSPKDASKAVAMAQLVKIAREVAKKKAWKDLEKHAFVRIIQQIAKALGVRLTKAKLAQTIPVTGAAVGGGFNAYYTAKTCKAAYYLYRERFLARKYNNPDIIEVTVAPAETFEPDYGTEDIPGE